MFKICTSCAQDLHKTCSTLVQDQLKMCSISTRDMFKICTRLAKYLHKTCSTLVQDQLKMCSRSTRDMFKICTRLAQRLFKICTRNGREFAVTKSIEVPTWNGEKVVFALIGIGLSSRNSNCTKMLNDHRPNDTTCNLRNDNHHT